MFQGYKKGSNNIPQCTMCNKYNHLQCVELTGDDFPLPIDWQCKKCCTQSLPFSAVTNDDLLLTIEALDKKSAEFLKNVPSFSIQTLIDKLPGQKFDTDEFISDNTESKYHTPAQFVSEKLSKKSFTMFHMNIASLQAHIGELRTLLTLLDHPFDAICITETRLHEPSPLVNINITGYDFLHTPTTTTCGGAGMYVKSVYHAVPLKKFTASHTDICETIFTEIKSNSKKNLIIGCIYRHHSTIPLFCSTYLTKTLNQITNSKKTCALLGDFNVDLIKYGDHPDVTSFYDLVTSHGFRPLILQPTRLRTKTGTLIDNIFINDLSCTSKGGNINTSISDHLVQFSQVNIFDSTPHVKAKRKPIRNWRIFNKREFAEELTNTNWDDVSDVNADTNTSFSNFYNRVTTLLDEMAPLKTPTKREVRLQQKPWITSGILKSMAKRDIFHKDFATEKNPEKKERLGMIYRSYRNLIVTLLRTSKKKYHTDYFEEHKQNMKKTWDGIRDLINVSKKSSTNINEIIHDKQSFTDNKDIAKALNNYFVNIGPSIEEKIPKGKHPFQSYLGEQNPVALTLNPCDADEIAAIIATFGAGKASGPFSIPTNLLKEFSQHFSKPISIIVNKSLQEGVYPQLLKSELVCAI